VRLASGAEARATGPVAGPAVVCVNGGRGAELPGTWSASLEWLVQRLAPRLPHVRFLEVRYRVRSWRRLDDCIEDARAAVGAVAGDRILLLGFSMGGAVAIGAAAEPGVTGVLGLAPWIPPQLDLGPLRGKRLDVLHGALDRALPGIPGVSPASSRRGVERAASLGVETSYELVPRAPHAIALRAPSGRPVPLPGARAWLRGVARHLDAFAR
jgi:dienelactone hydrolase